MLLGVRCGGLTLAEALLDLCLEACDLSVGLRKAERFLVVIAERKGLGGRGFTLGDGPGHSAGGRLGFAGWGGGGAIGRRRRLVLRRFTTS